MTTHNTLLHIIKDESTFSNKQYNIIHS